MYSKHSYKTNKTTTTVSIFISPSNVFAKIGFIRPKLTKGKWELHYLTTRHHHGALGPCNACHRRSSCTVIPLSMEEQSLLPQNRWNSLVVCTRQVVLYKVPGTWYYYARYMDTWYFETSVLVVTKVRRTPTRRALILFSFF